MMHRPLLQVPDLALTSHREPENCSPDFKYYFCIFVVLQTKLISPCSLTNQQAQGEIQKKSYVWAFQVISCLPTAPSLPSGLCLENGNFPPCNRSLLPAVFKPAPAAVPRDVLGCRLIGAMQIRPVSRLPVTVGTDQPPSADSLSLLLGKASDGNELNLVRG